MERQEIDNQPKGLHYHTQQISVAKHPLEYEKIYLSKLTDPFLSHLDVKV